MFLNRFYFVFLNVFSRVFTFKNIRKIFIVFVVGFSFRVGINYFWGINVFVDYLSFVSLVYYGFMSCFLIALDEIFLVIPSSDGIGVKNSELLSNICSERSNESTYTRRPSAAVLGLYGNSNNSVDSNSIVGSNLNTSVKIKARVCWITWKHFMTEHTTYKKFVGSLDTDFSVRKEFKKDIKKVFGK